MLNSKGVSIISLIVTIIIIVIIAAISTPLLSSVIDDAFQKDAKEEVANVENVLAYAKSQILIDEFTPNPDYIISDAQLDNKFSAVLDSSEVDYIKEVNGDPLINNLQKFYLMDQDKFDSEFKNGFNIDNIRADREYLINYYDGTVVTNYDGTRVANVEKGDIKGTSIVERGDVTITIFPNGNSNWIKGAQNVLVKFDWKAPGVDNIGAIRINEVKYCWSDSTTQPEDTKFINNVLISPSERQFVADELSGKTGSNWCLWIRVQYTEAQTGRDITKYVHSSPFFLDSTNPTADLFISEVK